MSMIKDPVIRKAEALKKYNGNQAALARVLGVTRTTVCDWQEFIPPLHAYRLRQIYPDLVEGYE